ncbi:HET-domain-containing protein [Trematosphaeria pertusa]|uniref:HET-domain-containing protein n=1 Tax=Trematosphaeria pertusa TaxID=390896 RepID=A0A6A6ITL8_9PLEO|nr:HET-domain-containing protein [Trematosphaeria pertusa]KAF2253746.1 HET-domain-containing protein [Trematosphaeria pertusa]
MTESLPARELDIARLCAVCREAALFHDDNERLVEIMQTDGLPRLESDCFELSRPYSWEDTLPGLPRLHESFREGCGFCGVLRDIIMSKDTDEAAVKHLGTSLQDMEGNNVSISAQHRWTNKYIDDWRSDGMVGLAVQLDFATLEGSISLFFLAEAVSGADDVARWLGIAAPMSQSYLEEHRLLWMKQKLADCERHGHEAEVDFVPERLVDVQGPIPRLVERRDFPIPSASSKVLQYAALSYCWGSREDAKAQLKTTSSSMLQRQSAIQDHEMTEVLRDAVYLTKALSVPYLWVDALCILQDDISDWETQCADMTKIYGNAYVTLCAASSTSCGEGFLRQRGIRVRVPFQSRRRPTITGSYYLQAKYVSNVEYLDDEMSSDHYYTRWYCRGWTFQERVSSTRKLLFGNANIHFFCENRSETMGGATLDESYETGLPRSREWSHQRLYDAWASILRTYSTVTRRSFTVATDLLPALSGLAMHFCKNLQDDFLAGIWRRDLLRGLMWQVDKARLPNHVSHLDSLRQSHGNYLSPSWSRLGISNTTRGIEAFRDTYSDCQPETEILNAETELIGSNPFGAVRNGWLRIRSSVLDIAAMGTAKLTIEKAVTSYLGWLLRYDGKGAAIFKLDFTYVPFNWEEHNHVNEDAAILENIQTLTLVLLGSCNVNNPYEVEGMASHRLLRGAFGLILHPVPDSDKFYRVGAFYPALPKEHSFGLCLFQRTGKVRTVEVI